MEKMEESECHVSDGRRVSVFDYEQSLMLGRYRDQLSQIAREIAVNSYDKNKFRKRRFIELNERNLFLKLSAKIFHFCGDWLILICLGVCISFLSFVIDLITHYLFDCKYSSFV